MGSHSFRYSLIYYRAGLSRDKGYAVIHKANTLLAGGKSAKILSNNKDYYLGNLRENK